MLTGMLVGCLTHDSAVVSKQRFFEDLENFARADAVEQAIRRGLRRWKIHEYAATAYAALALTQAH